MTSTFSGDLSLDIVRPCKVFCFFFRIFYWGHPYSLLLRYHHCKIVLVEIKKVLFILFVSIYS